MVNSSIVGFALRPVVSFFTEQKGMLYVNDRYIHTWWWVLLRRRPLGWQTVRTCRSIGLMDVNHILPRVVHDGQVYTEWLQDANPLSSPKHTIKQLAIYGATCLVLRIAQTFKNAKSTRERDIFYGRSGASWSQIEFDVRLTFLLLTRRKQHSLCLLNAVRKGAWNDVRGIGLRGCYLRFGISILP